MFGIVINDYGFKVAFITLSEDKTPKFYELQDGEEIIETDWNIANSMNKPKWDNVKWIDTDPLPPVEQPIQEHNKIDICLKEIAKLTEEKGILAQNVYDMASILEAILIGGITE